MDYLETAHEQTLEFQDLSYVVTLLLAAPVRSAPGPAFGLIEC